MSFGYNHVTMIGNLADDPRELRTTTSGHSVTDFRIAVNDPLRKDAQALFIDVTAWGKTAENCSKYLRKGKPVLVDGQLVEERWTDKDGKDRSKCKINAQAVQFMPDGKRDTDENSGGDDDERTVRRPAPAATPRKADERPAQGGAAPRHQPSLDNEGKLKSYGFDKDVPF